MRGSSEKVTSFAKINFIADSPPGKRSIPEDSRECPVLDGCKTLILFCEPGNDATYVRSAELLTYTQTIGLSSYENRTIYPFETVKRVLFHEIDHVHVLDNVLF